MKAARGWKRKKSIAAGRPGKRERIASRYRAVTRPRSSPAAAPTRLIATLSSTICCTTCAREMPIARSTAISPRRSFTDTVTSVVTSRKPTIRLTAPRITDSCRK